MSSKNDDLKNGLEDYMTDLRVSYYIEICSSQNGTYAPQCIAEYLKEAYNNYRTGGILLTHDQLDTINWLCKKGSEDCQEYWEYFMEVLDMDLLETDENGQPFRVLIITHNDDGDYYICPQAVQNHLSSLQDISDFMSSEEISDKHINMAYFNTLKIEDIYDRVYDVLTLPTIIDEETGQEVVGWGRCPIKDIKECRIIYLHEIEDKKEQEELREYYTDLMNDEDIAMASFVHYNDTYYYIGDFIRLDRADFWHGANDACLIIKLADGGESAIVGRI